jgi:hypothetical protein
MTKQQLDKLVQKLTELTRYYDSGDREGLCPMYDTEEVERWVRHHCRRLKVQ